MPRQKEKRVAVDDLTLGVPQGGLFGFLGPNGAGKTTTIKMLLGFIPPTTGEAWLFDSPWAMTARASRVGYLPEQPYFPKFLSALEVVRAHAGLSGLTGGTRAKERVEGCLRQVGMWENRHMVLSKCSKGMTQRVGLASALVGDPDLLIMDEPSSGLDPVGRKELRALLTTLKNEGKTIFLSSHLLSEMESVCDRVGVMARGKLVACGTPQEITRARDEVRVQIEQAERDEVSDGAGRGLGRDAWRRQARPERACGCRPPWSTASWACWNSAGRGWSPSRRSAKRWKTPSCGWWEANTMQALRNIGIIGRITMLEGARKQVFHVLMLFAVFLIFGSATLAKFDRHVQMKMLNDLCLFSVFLVSSVVAITLTVTGIPGEMEQKTVYPVIAKPVARWQFVCGKYAGAMGTVAIGMAVMAATFSFLQVFYMGHLDPAMFYVLPFLFLETAILAALALWLSTWPPGRWPGSCGPALPAGQCQVPAVCVPDGPPAERVQPPDDRRPVPPAAQPGVVQLQGRAGASSDGSERLSLADGGLRRLLHGGPADAGLADIRPEGTVMEHRARNPKDRAPWLLLPCILLTLSGVTLLPRARPRRPPRPLPRRSRPARAVMMTATAMSCWNIGATPNTPGRSGSRWRAWPAGFSCWADSRYRRRVRRRARRRDVRRSRDVTERRKAA